MKRLAFIIALLLPVLANAQVKILKEYDDETLYSPFSTHDKLVLIDGHYQLVFSTTSSVDEYAILFLGTDKESAVKTLKDLKNLFQTMPTNHRVVIDSGYNERITLRVDFSLGTKVYYLFFSDHVGSAGTTMKFLDNCIGILEGNITTDDGPTDEEDESRYR